MTPPTDDKARTSDWVASALIPLYGAIGGLIAKSNAQPRRGTTMLILSVVNLYAIGYAARLLLKH